MEKELPRRKQLRYDGLNYDAPGAYFITFCTHNKENTLSRVVGAIHESPESVELPRIELTAQGEIVRRSILALSLQENVTVDQYVIMPNHVHLIAVLGEQEKRAIRESPLRACADNEAKRQRSLLSKVIGRVKMNAAREIRALYGCDKIWQRGYYDHVIRDRRDYDEHVKYITENPMRWRFDELYREQ